MNLIVVATNGAIEQFNGREGETATFLSRCPLNSSGLLFGFAPRHLNRYASFSLLRMKNNSEIVERERQMMPLLESEEASNSLATVSEPDKELLWKQYALHVDLYKHYLDLVLKFNIFYYASTGAILSFYFSKTDVGLIKFSLLFPIMASVCFGVLFLYGANALRVTRQEMFDIRDKLDLDTAPEFNVLGGLLLASALLMFGVAGVILWLFLNK